MTILEILEAHRTLASSPEDKVCACDRTWRPDAEYRAHLAEVLDKHMQERILAWQEQAWDACSEAWEQAHSLDNIEPWGYLPDNPYKENQS